MSIYSCEIVYGESTEAWQCKAQHDEENEQRRMALLIPLSPTQNVQKGHPARNYDIATFATGVKHILENHCFLNVGMVGRNILLDPDSR